VILLLVAFSIGQSVVRASSNTPSDMSYCQSTVAVRYCSLVAASVSLLWSSLYVGVIYFHRLMKLV
jgi:hypothetical protein